MLPKLLTSRLKTILGPDYENAMHAFLKERNGSFRINLLKGDGSEVFSEFEKKGINTTPFEPLPGVYFFDKKDDYALKGTDAFYGGKIYLQSLASLLPVMALAPLKGETILDVCAAPGSKTTQIAMMMQNEGSIAALEQNSIRFDKLIYNCNLQGATIVSGEKLDARRYFEASKIFFDRILLDAPCSAEGRIQIENEKSYGFWTLDNIKKKSETQYELLLLATRSLKKGGTLVYSTCTLAPEENEGVLTRILKENPEISLDPIDIGLGGKSWWREGITSFGSQEYNEAVKNSVRILPSSETEGFYIAKLVKH